MDQISRIRFKNLLDRMLIFFEEAREDKEKAVILRIGVVVLNRLRVHADTMLGQDVRDLNNQIILCESRNQLIDFIWPEVEQLLRDYRNEFV